MLEFALQTTACLLHLLPAGVRTRKNIWGGPFPTQSLHLILCRSPREYQPLASCTQMFWLVAHPKNSICFCPFLFFRQKLTYVYSQGFTCDLCTLLPTQEKHLHQVSFFPLEGNFNWLIIFFQSWTPQRCVCTRNLVNGCLTEFQVRSLSSEIKQA